MPTDLTPADWQALSAAALIAIGALFSVITLFALRLGKKATAQFEKSTGIKLTEAQHRMRDDAIAKVIAYAQERAHKAARGLLEGGPTVVNGPEKLEIAKSAARSLAPQAFVDVSEDQLEILIEAKLASARPPPDPFAKLRATTGRTIPPPAAVPHFDSGHAPFSPSAKTPLPPSRRPER